MSVTAHFFRCLVQFIPSNAGERCSIIIKINARVVSGKAISDNKVLNTERTIAREVADVADDATPPPSKITPVKTGISDDINSLQEAIKTDISVLIEPNIRKSDKQITEQNKTLKLNKFE